MGDLCNGGTSTQVSIISSAVFFSDLLQWFIPSPVTCGRLEPGQGRRQAHPLHPSSFLPSHLFTSSSTSSSRCSLNDHSFWHRQLVSIKIQLHFDSTPSAFIWDTRNLADWCKVKKNCVPLSSSFNILDEVSDASLTSLMISQDNFSFH